MVRCEICGWQGKQISTGHLQKHGLKVADYKRMFPNAPLTSLETKNKTSQAARNRPPQSQETKERISKTMQQVYQRPQWKLRVQNKNQMGTNNHFYGKHHTQATKAALSASSTQWLKQAYKQGQKVSPFTWLGWKNQMSTAEAYINECLQSHGFVFDFQVPFTKGCYKIDFALPDKMLGFEIDSKLHRAEAVVQRDARKDHYLTGKGWTIKRFYIDSSTNLDEIVQAILHAKETHHENSQNRKGRRLFRTPL